MKIYLNTIGCRLNQAELENYARQFRAAGHMLVADPTDADLAIINTCTVTSAAAADSRGKIRQAARAGISEIIATGCYATLQPDVVNQLPGVAEVVPNACKELLVPRLLEIPRRDFELEPVERLPIPGARLRTRAFIKVQDGCNNRCSFCITTVARGAGYSSGLDRVLADINTASQYQEVVLTGVHLGSWGQDLTPKSNLYNLVKTILESTDVPRVRLSSLEPWDVNERFFDLWKNPRLCRQLHLPLQSGSEGTLRRMARKTTPREYSSLVEHARRSIPGVSITTDIITGFPGETEAEFAESLEFVRQMKFSAGHVFTYSLRPGTAAAEMPGQIPVSIRKERNSLMRAVIAESSQIYRSQFINQVLPVLWESATNLDPDGWQMSGLTDNYLRVKARAPKSLWNQITPVLLTDINSDAMLGQIVNAVTR